MMHLGSRVSALLDGRLPADEEERAWAHVHDCHPCRDLVEREGWVKTRLAGLSMADRTGCGAPDRLKSSLLASCTSAPARSQLAPSPFVTAAPTGRPRSRSLVVIGGGAAGAAVVGVLALGTANAPQLDRRAPSDLSRPVPSSNPTPDDRTVDRPSRRSPRPPRRIDARRDDDVSGPAVSGIEVLPQAAQVRMGP